MKKELPKTEVDWSKFPKATQEKVGYVEPKQETLEEAALRLYPIILDDDWDKNLQYREEFIEGAKGQQERSYSEESECVNMYLDDLKIPRKSQDDKEYSIVGRIKQLEKKYLKQLSEVENYYLQQFKNK